MRRDNTFRFLTLPTVMFLILFTLKLCGVIDWSWWRVTAPLWAPVAFAAAVAALTLAAVALVIGVTWLYDYFRPEVK